MHTLSLGAIPRTIWDAAKHTLSARVTFLGTAMAGAARTIRRRQVARSPRHAYGKPQVGGALAAPHPARHPAGPAAELRGKRATDPGLPPIATAAAG